MELMSDRIKAALSSQQAPAAAPAPGLQAPQGAEAAMTPEGPMSMDVVNREVESMMQNNPEMVQELRAEMVALMESGELTPEELNKSVQLAQAALQNPEVYPQLRLFAIQQGIGSEEELPEEYDQGLLISVVIAGRALQEGGTGEGELPVPSFQDGGPVMGKKPGASVVAEVHDGEFVIPSDVVRRIGEEKLEKIIESARNPKPKGDAGLTKP